MNRVPDEFVQCVYSARGFLGLSASQPRTTLGTVRTHRMCFFFSPFLAVYEGYALFWDRILDNVLSIQQSISFLPIAWRENGPIIIYGQDKRKN
jgi:hypothetical protein